MDKINEVLDDPRFTGIVNSSSWPVTKCINTATKNEFLQFLIFGEVIQKRQHAIQAFCRGLDFLSVHTLLKENPELMKQAFLDVHSKDITPDTFIGLISTPRPMDENRGIIYDWFMEYLQDYKREASLEHILQFCTGLKRIPPMGLKDQIKIKYLLTSPLPMAEACFCIIQLPTVHTDKTIFFSKLDQGILFSLNHFGQI